MPRLESFGLERHIILDRRMDYSTASSGFLACMQCLRGENVAQLSFVIVYKMAGVGILCFRRALTHYRAVHNKFTQSVAEQSNFTFESPKRITRHYCSLSICDPPILNLNYESRYSQSTWLGREHDL